MIFFLWRRRTHCKPWGEARVALTLIEQERTHYCVRFTGIFACVYFARWLQEVAGRMCRQLIRHAPERVAGRRLNVGASQAGCLRSN